MLWLKPLIPEVTLLSGLSVTILNYGFAIVICLNGTKLLEETCCFTADFMFFNDFDCNWEHGVNTNLLLYVLSILVLIVVESFLASDYRITIFFGGTCCSFNYNLESSPLIFALPYSPSLALLRFLITNFLDPRLLFLTSCLKMLFWGKSDTL